MIGNSSARNLYEIKYRESLFKGPEPTSMEEFVYIVGTILLVSLILTTVSAAPVVVVVRRWLHEAQESQPHIVTKEPATAKSRKPDEAVVPPERASPQGQVAPLPVDEEPTWQLLAKVVAEAERTPSTRANEAVRDVFNSKVKSIPAGELSDEQRRLVTKTEQIVRALNQSDDRLNALVEAAKHWRERSGPECEDFSKVMSGIGPYDKQRLNEDDFQSAWDTLSAAAGVLRSRDVAMEEGTISGINLNIAYKNSSELDENLSNELRDQLAAEGRELPFKIVDSYSNSALTVEIYDAARNSSQWVSNLGEPYKTSFKFRAIWVGGQILFNEQKADIAYKAGPHDDAGYESLKNSVAKAVVFLMSKARHP